MNWQSWQKNMMVNYGWFSGIGRIIFISVSFQLLLWKTQKISVHRMPWDFIISLTVFGSIRLRVKNLKSV